MVPRRQRERERKERMLGQEASSFPFYFIWVPSQWDVPLTFMAVLPTLVNPLWNDLTDTQMFDLLISWASVCPSKLTIKINNHRKISLFFDIGAE
jgi:hypothetical protein